MWNLILAELGEPPFKKLNAEKKIELKWCFEFIFYTFWALLPLPPHVYAI